MTTPQTHSPCSLKLKQYSEPCIVLEEQFLSVLSKGVTPSVLQFSLTTPQNQLWRQRARAASSYNRRFVLWSWKHKIHHVLQWAWESQTPEWCQAPHGASLPSLALDLDP